MEQVLAMGAWRQVYGVCGSGKRGWRSGQESGGPGGPYRVAAVVLRWCSARSSAPWRGGALGRVGAAEACGLAALCVHRPGGGERGALWC